MITQLNQSRYGYWSRVMVLPVSIILFFSVALYAGEKKSRAADYTTRSAASEEIFYLSFKVPEQGGITDLIFYNERPDTHGQKLHEITITAKESVAEMNMQADEKRKYYMDEIALTFKSPYLNRLKPQLEMERTHYLKIIFRPDSTLAPTQLNFVATNMDGIFQKTDTIPAAERQADKIRDLKVIREKQILLEKISQEKLPFSYDEKNTREMQLKIAYNEQLILEKMLQEKEIKANKEVTNSIQNKLVELKLQQQTLQEININTNKNTNNDQHFNYDEKLVMEKEKNDIQALKKELVLREDSKKELEKIDIKLKTLNDVQQKELTLEQHFDYVKEDTIPRTLIRFFNKNFRYPMEMIENGGEGSTWYSVLLDETGKLRDYEIYNEEPAAAKGRVQEIVIVGYAKQSGTVLSAEKTQQLIKNEVLRLSEKGVSLFGTAKIIPARYYYKATFRLEKKK